MKPARWKTKNRGKLNQLPILDRCHSSCLTLPIGVSEAQQTVTRQREPTADAKSPSCMVPVVVPVLATVRSQFWPQFGI
jgi:hypothetical protein